MSIAQYQKRPIGARAAKTAAQNQALFNANLSRNPKLILYNESERRSNKGCGKQSR
jgi:hypothetical protein